MILEIDMKRLLFYVLSIFLITLTACHKEAKTGVRTNELVSEWEFVLADQIDSLPTEGWRSVTIPHDWAIEQPFDRQYDLQEVTIVQNGEQTPSVKTGRSGGLPWMGKAWYKTTISTPDANRCYTLLFDGAMSHATVYINGEKACYWPYGYNSFEVDVTPFVRGKQTEVWVSLENKEESSRWYPGAGLYRHVHLITTARTHVPVWGTVITTPEVSAEQARVNMHINVTHADSLLLVNTQIYLGDSLVTTMNGCDAECIVEHPALWSPESPSLYTARTTIIVSEQLVDEYDTRFGIRSIDYSPEYGFRLNGEPRKFQGVCLHHDLGPLGTAVWKDAIRHQLTLLKDMGCDAIRTSHNMPAPELIELCEEMGFMVMVEPFDVWNWGKIKNDYSVHFLEWYERDITNMVRQYRNSPAVVMWSSGNEVWNQVLPDGIAIVTELQDLFHRLDPTRPVTNGMDQAMHIIHNGFGAAVELPGLNYRTGRYQEAYQHLPQKMLLGSETASTVSSRGVYKLPVRIQPDAMYEDNQCSGYDVEYCAWSGLPEQDFALQDDYPWTLGQFVWTGFDYLGEPSPYDTDAWPSHSSYFGIIDLASLPKDRYWLYRSQWNKTAPTLHLLPHWNWQTGDTVPLFCYTSYPEAELFVNGKSQGRKCFATKDNCHEAETVPVGEFEIPVWGSAPEPQLLPRYRLMWLHVPYEAGEIKVVAYDANGQAAAEQVIRTAGVPNHIVLTHANAGEPTEEGLVYVTISVCDANGQLCPDANNEVHLRVSGKARLLGVANGNPACLTPFYSETIPVFAGQATAILQATGKFTLTAEAEGLRNCELSTNH